MSSIDPQYFVDLYQRERDPWSFETSHYEAEKYCRSLEALAPYYRSGLELGCSIGVFTSMLATRCAALRAIDVSPDAIEIARARCAEQSWIEFVVGPLPDAFPAGEYDLVTLCELGFYLDVRDLATLKKSIVRSLRPGGDLLLVHWTPPVRGHAQSAHDVHRAFLRDDHFSQQFHDERETYVLDVLARRTG